MGRQQPAEEHAEWRPLVGCFRLFTTTLRIRADPGISVQGARENLAVTVAVVSRYKRCRIASTACAQSHLVRFRWAIVATMVTR